MSITEHLKLEVVRPIESQIFGHRIAYIIETRGISKAWVAEKLGISKQALNYLLKNAIKPKFIDELAELLELNPNWVETGQGISSAKSRTDKFLIHKIPILKKAALLGAAIKPEDHQEFIDFIDHSRDVIAYKLEDGSNFPPFMPGSILFFDKKKHAEHGDYVLLKIENDIFVRQFAYENNNIYYRPSHNSYQTFINPEATLLGIFFEARYQIS